MPAATSAPNASTRMISVIGSDSVSAFWKSSLEGLRQRLVRAGVAELADEDGRVARA